MDGGNMNKPQKSSRDATSRNVTTPSFPKSMRGKVRLPVLDPQSLSALLTLSVLLTKKGETGTCMQAKNHPCVKVGPKKYIMDHSCEFFGISFGPSRRGILLGSFGPAATFAVPRCTPLNVGFFVPESHQRSLAPLERPDA